MGFQVGDQVQSVTDPQKIGIIVRLGPRHAGMQFYVVNFGGGQQTTIAEMDIRLYEGPKRPVDNLLALAFGGYKDFQRLITLQKLRRDIPLRNNINAINASRTRFYPYQFKPLLKFLDSPRHRILIADEVGLGKTIEAGLILLEMKARQDIQNIMIVCPANLTDKWHLEMKHRFAEEFKILKGSDLIKLLNEYEDTPEQTPIRLIISLESIRGQNVLERFDEVQPSLDLVIVDEAHHMRNFGTQQRAAGVLLSQATDAMLCLTATPIHLGNQDLFSLLNILDEEEFREIEAITQRFRDNEHIVRAQSCIAQLPPDIDRAREYLKDARDVPLIAANPLYDIVISKLQRLNCLAEGDQDFRRLLSDVQRDMAGLNLIGDILTRTRKKEVREYTAERHAFSIKMIFTEAEKEFYDAVTNFVRLESQRRTRNPVLLQWRLNNIHRQMASSIPAMVEKYRKKIEIDDFELEDLEVPTEIDSESPQTDDMMEAYQRLKVIVEKWNVKSPDTKYQKFVEMLKQLDSTDDKLKIIVFSFYKGTLRYLAKRLEQEGIGYVMIHGDIPATVRPAHIERFRNDPAVKVLLSSRVGSEGLDFQFSDTLFNYDLPWNPMEVEQRIGRLDRIGQEAAVIRIYNFWIEGTIEQRILERLFERIDIFKRSIGGLEAILGKVIIELERDLLSKKLTPEEEREIIERAAKVVSDRLDEVEELEQRAAVILGADYYFNEEIELVRKNRRYVASEHLYAFMTDFFEHHCPQTRVVYGFGEHKGRIYPDTQLQCMITQLGYATSMSRFYGHAPNGISFTMDSNMAFRDPIIEFINVLHPLIRLIIQKYQDAKLTAVNAHCLVLSSTSIATGEYYYFIYRLKVLAARGYNSLIMYIIDQESGAITSPEDCEVILAEMIEKGRDQIIRTAQIEREKLKNSENLVTDAFLKRIAEIREEVLQNNGVFVDRRAASVKVFYQKKIEKLKSLLERAEYLERKEQYIRMLRGNLNRLEREWQEKIATLDKQRQVEVNYDEVAAGILEVVEDGIQN